MSSNLIPSNPRAARVAERKETLMLKWLAALAVLFSSVIPAQAQMMTGMDGVSGGNAGIYGGAWWPDIPNFQGPTLEDNTQNAATLTSANSTGAIAYCGTAFWDAASTTSRMLQSVSFQTHAITQGSGATLEIAVAPVSTSSSPLQPGSIISGATTTIAMSSVAATSWISPSNFGTAPTINFGEQICIEALWSAAGSGASFTFGNWNGELDYGVEPGIMSYNGTSWSDTGNETAPAIELNWLDGTSSRLAMGVPGTSSGANSAYNENSTTNEQGAFFSSPITFTTYGIALSITCASASSTFTIEITNSSGVQQVALPETCENAARSSGGNMGMGPFTLPSPGFTFQANTTYYIGVLATSTTNITLSSMTASANTVIAAGPAGSSFYYAQRTNSGGSGSWSTTSTKMPYTQVRYDLLSTNGTLTLIPGGLTFPSEQTSLGPYFHSGALTAGNTVASLTSVNSTGQIVQCGAFYQFPYFAGTKSITNVLFPTTNSTAAGSPDGQVQVAIYTPSTTSNPLQPGTLLGAASSGINVGSLVSGGWVSNFPALATSAPVSEGEFICAVFSWASAGTGATFAYGAGSPAGGDWGFMPASSSYNGSAYSINSIHNAPQMQFALSDGSYASFDGGYTGTVTGNYYSFNSGLTTTEYGMQVEFPWASTTNGILAGVYCTDTSTTYTIEVTTGGASPAQLSSTTRQCNEATKAGGGTGISQGAGIAFFPVPQASLSANTQYYIGVSCTSASPHNCQLPYMTTAGASVTGTEPGGPNFVLATRSGSGAWTTNASVKPALFIHLNQVS